MVTPDAKRKAVAHACTVHAVSQRRACLALTIDRSTVRYTSIRPDDALLREAMKAVAAERRRFGYRRIHIMLDRQSIVMNQKKRRRLYREEKLQVRRRGGRKRALGTRRPMLVPDWANTRWSLACERRTIIRQCHHGISFECRQWRTAITTGTARTGVPPRNSLG